MTAPVTDTVPPPAKHPGATPTPPQAPGRCVEDRAKIWSQAMAAHDRARWLIKQSQELRVSARVLAQESADTRRARLNGRPSRPQPDMLQRSEYWRLLARLETMPVIEQAKGIIMAHQGCDPEDAFDLLRRASQRSNVPVRELAARLVATTVSASQVTRKAG